MAQFVSGWTPEAYAAAKARQDAAGIRRYRVTGADIAPPPAFSLSAHRLRHLEQGQAGTCWVHAATQLGEVFAAANGKAAFPVCRRLVGYQGKRLEGGGNPSNGGSPSDALDAMTDVESRGVGIAHEELWPYTDSYRGLAESPPDNVLADAKGFSLTAPVDVKSDDEARRLIANNHPIANGIWWPYGWDGEGQTFFSTIGAGTYGHALLEIGYVLPGVFDEYPWFQLDNWHGLLYRPLAPAYAAKVPGYKPITPDRTSDFWVRADVYQRVRDYGNAERVSATDLHGFADLFTLSDVFADAFGQGFRAA